MKTAIMRHCSSLGGFARVASRETAKRAIKTPVWQAFYKTTATPLLILKSYRKESSP